MSVDAAGGCVCATLHVSVRVWTWHQCVYICMTVVVQCVCVTCGHVALCVGVYVCTHLAACPCLSPQRPCAR